MEDDLSDMLTEEHFHAFGVITRTTLYRSLPEGGRAGLIEGSA